MAATAGASVSSWLAVFPTLVWDQRTTTRLAAVSALGTRFAMATDTSRLHRRGDETCTHQRGSLRTVREESGLEFTYST
jgi:hypothetical protein